MNRRRRSRGRRHHWGTAQVHHSGGTTHIVFVGDPVLSLRARRATINPATLKQAFTRVFTNQPISSWQAAVLAEAMRRDSGCWRSARELWMQETEVASGVDYQAVYAADSSLVPFSAVAEQRAAEFGRARRAREWSGLARNRGSTMLSARSRTSTRARRSRPGRGRSGARPTGRSTQRGDPDLDDDGPAPPVSSSVCPLKVGCA